MRFCGNDNDDDGLYFNVRNLVSLRYILQYTILLCLQFGLKDFKERIFRLNLKLSYTELC